MIKKTNVKKKKSSSYATFLWHTQQIKQWLSKWNERFLSIGGRVTLLNFVLNSIPIYLFSFFRALKCVIRDIIRIQHDFLWGGDSEKRKVAWINWRHVCSPEEQGGLWVKYCEFFNLSLFSKWKWRILNKDGAIWPCLLSLRCEDIKSFMLDDSKLIIKSCDYYGGGTWIRLAFWMRITEIGFRTIFRAKLAMVPLMNFYETNGWVHIHFAGCSL